MVSYQEEQDGMPGLRFIAGCHGHCTGYDIANLPCHQDDLQISIAGIIQRRMDSPLQHDRRAQLHPIANPISAPRLPLLGHTSRPKTPWLQPQGMQMPIPTVSTSRTRIIFQTILYSFTHNHLRSSILISVFYGKHCPLTLSAEKYVRVL
jgi:hypothetical protein